ncbi:MAG: hypothetical protein CMP23_13875 [Rickettsiales bacterium]|nr:hypothetical protein [Rickettsiales bacterium]
MALLMDVVLLGGCAWLLARLAARLGVPPLLGMILAGVLLARLQLPFGPEALRLDSLSSPLRVALPTVLLLRAGLGLSVAELRRVGSVGLRLGFLPLLADAAVLWLASRWLLRLDPLAAAVLAFLVAALSPAIVLPGLLALIGARPQGSRERSVLQTLLVGAPLDNVFALVLMGLALDAALVGSGELGDLLPALAWKVGVGAAAGVLTGLGLVRAMRLVGAERHARRLLLAVLVVGLMLLWAGVRWQFSFILAQVALGLTLRALLTNQVQPLDAQLKGCWEVAQYALFGLIGAALPLEPVVSVGAAVLVVVLMGQLGRLVGSYLATVGAGFTGPERLACALAYVPKATIQAAFAALPLDRVLALGAASALSVEDAQLILCAGVLAVVITAPIGSVTLQLGVDRLLSVKSPPK